MASHLRYEIYKGARGNGCLDYRVCPECGGDRVSAEARQVTLSGLHIGQLSRMTLAELGSFLCSLSEQAQLSPLGKNLLGDIRNRLQTLHANGLSHLTLYRSLPSLSGGELQRLFLSTHIGSELDSLIYVLDEPTIGLHEVEKQRLLSQLRVLQSLGNTILLVEHDPHLIAAADHIIDIGPLAGSAGGEIVYQGDYSGLLAAPHSVTGSYLSGRARLPAREIKPILPAAAHLKLSEVRTNNLQGVEVRIPLGALVGVAGVSGSGKSSLVMKTLVPLLERCFTRRGRPADENGDVDPGEEPSVFFAGARLEGAERIRGFSAVSQQPIGRHDNSNPATYLKIWASHPQAFCALCRSPGARFRTRLFFIQCRWGLPNLLGQRQAAHLAGWGVFRQPGLSHLPGPALSGGGAQGPLPG